MARSLVGVNRSCSRFFAAYHRCVSLSSTIIEDGINVTGPCVRQSAQYSSSHRSFSAAQSLGNYGASAQEASHQRTHYTLFPLTLPNGPPPKGSFEVPLSELKKEFLQLQARAHPDRHSGSDKKRAEGTSALINEAYKTLQDPLRRAQYLLLLRGIDIAEDERAKTDDMELLEEVMEVRGLIEGAAEEAELAETRKRNAKRIESSVEVLKEAFSKDDMEIAKTEAVRLRYWMNIKQSLDDWEAGKPVILIH